MSNDEVEISKEWGRLFTSQLERHEKELGEYRRDCSKCREDLIERIAELKARQREIITKVMVGAVILGLLADVGIRYLLK